MVGAVIVGAGEGKRMGATARKQFVKIGGRPIIAYTLDVFEKTPLVDHMVIVVPRDAIDWVREEIVGEYGYKKVHAIVYGGETRQESVANGLKALKPGTKKVLIHDAVRPLVSETLIRRVLDASEKTGAAITAVPAKDTVKRVESGDIVGTLDKRLLWLAQTPQSFNYDIIVNAHAKSQGQSLDATDDAALVEAAGVKVAVAVGSYSNLKMTSPEDLPMFEYFLGQDVKSKIDAAVDQGGQGGRARPIGHRRRRPRRGRRGEAGEGGGEGNNFGEATRPPGRQHPGGQRREQRPDHPRERARRHGAEQGSGRPREQGHERMRDRPKEHSGQPQRGPLGEQRRDHPRERGREHPREPMREQGRERQRDHTKEPRLAQDRDGIRRP